ncbi:alpha/beta fold hydrolase [Lentimicrobium saccharophilum]|uniref:alpha/beta fold hydrolase n=1 Tax=Lentimicrobium saccharophilum TaxID=1678841 RepID=UPI000785A241|nr:alpha/beta hydrolase [Lentimicrobium saccharophilum]
MIPGILQVNRAEIPVYFLHGRYDYTFSCTLAKRCIEMFQAPEKAFITFEHSAHSPHFEEPERVREVPERILKGRGKGKRCPGVLKLPGKAVYLRGCLPMDFNCEKLSEITGMDVTYISDYSN